MFALILDTVANVWNFLPFLPTMFEDGSVTDMGCIIPAMGCSR